MQNEKTPLEYRPLLLKHALKHVEFDGWTNKALFAAADDLDISHHLAELAYPGGGAEMLADYLDDMNQRMVEDIQALPLSEMKIRDKITKAIKLRFDKVDSNKSLVAKTIATLSLPHNAVMGTKALWNISDAIWRAIGDTSMDHNFYTKRMTLSAVLSTVTLYWLNDTSENNADTWAFLDRRIEDVMKIESAKFQARKIADFAPSLSRFLGRLRYPTQ